MEKKEPTLDELKAAAYDQSRQIMALQNNVQKLNQAISQLEEKENNDKKSPPVKKD